MGFRLEMSRLFAGEIKPDEAQMLDKALAGLIREVSAMELIRLKVNSQYRPCVDQSTLFSWVITSCERM